MKRFYDRFHKCDSILRQLVAVLLWGNNLLLINKIKEDNQAAFYAEEVLTKGWSGD